MSAVLSANFVFKKSTELFITAIMITLDMRSIGHGFKSYLGQWPRNNLGQVVHTYLLLSLSSITRYRPRGGDALWLGR